MSETQARERSALPLSEQLLEAIDALDAKQVSALIKARVNPNEPIKGQSPCQIAAKMYDQKKSITVLKALIEAQADITKPDSSPLWTATAWGRSEVASFLLKQKADCNSISYEGTVIKSALLKAVNTGAENIVQLLIDAKAHIDKEAVVSAAKKGHTAILKTLSAKTNIKVYVDELCAKAALKGHAETVRFLLESKANPNLTVNEDKHSKTLVARACQLGDYALVRVLMKFNADVSTKKGAISVPLHNALYSAGIYLPLVLEALASRTKPSPDILHDYLKEVACSERPLPVVISQLSGLIAARAPFDPSPPRMGSALKEAKSRNLHQKIIDFFEDSMSRSKPVLKQKSSRPRSYIYGPQEGMLEAIIRSDLEQTSILLDAKADVNGHPHKSWLMYAAPFADGEKMVQLLLDRKADWQRVSENGETAYSIAINLGRVQTVQLLVEAGMDPNKFYGTGDPPLHRAISNNDHRMLTTLIGLKADIKKVNAEGYSPLTSALAQKDPDTVQILIEAKADHQARDADGNTLVHLAVLNILETNPPYHSQAAIEERATAARQLLSRLVNAGIELAATNSKGQTALHMAVTKGNMPMITALMSVKADPHYAPSGGISALAMARQYTHQEVVHVFETIAANPLLILHKESVSEKKQESDSHVRKTEHSTETEKPQPEDLYNAIEALDVDLVHRLLKKNVELFHKNEKDELPLNVAARMIGPKAIAIVQALLAARASLYESQHPPLLTAVRFGRKEMVQHLLSQKASCSHAIYREYSCETPLGIAIKYDDKELLEILLKAKAWPSLEKAITEGHGKMLEILLTHRLPMTEKHRSSYIPLVFREAAIKGHVDVVKILLKKGLAKISDIPNLLEKVAAKGRVEVVKVLLEAKASVEKGKAVGPLISACEFGQYEVARILVEAKADISAATSALDKALASGGEQLPHILHLFPVKLRPTQDRLCTALIDTLKQTSGVRTTKEIVSQLSGLLAAKTPVNFVLVSGSTVLEFAQNLCMDQAILDVLEEALAREKMMPLNTAAFKEQALVRQRPIERKRSSDLFAAIRRLDIQGAQRLIAEGADVNEIRNDRSLLTGVVMRDDNQGEKLARVLLEAKATANHAFKGETAFDLAIKKGRVRIVQALVEARADPNEAGKDHLKMAIDQDSPKMLRKLLELKANIEKTNSLNEPPLLYAARSGKIAAVKILTELMANPAAINPTTGNNALHVVVEAFRPPPDMLLLTQLVRARVGIHAVNAAGETALQMATKSEYIPLIKALIRVNASPTYIPPGGESVLQLARLTVHRNVVEALEKWSSNPLFALDAQTPREIKRQLPDKITKAQPERRINTLQAEFELTSLAKKQEPKPPASAEVSSSRPKEGLCVLDSKTPRDLHSQVPDKNTSRTKRRDSSPFALEMSIYARQQKPEPVIAQEVQSESSPPA